jgi:hypothetical protein
MFEIEQGGIYELLFPYTDLSETKYRSALALAKLYTLGDMCFAFITAAELQALNL